MTRPLRRRPPAVRGARRARHGRCVAETAALAGRYSLDGELGRGGMGVVYLANEVVLDCPVAIKLLPSERAANARLRSRGPLPPFEAARVLREVAWALVADFGIAVAEEGAAGGSRARRSS